MSWTQTVGIWTFAGTRDLSDEPAMLMLSLILLSAALLVCNLIYCGQHIMADLHQSRRVQIVWGVAALSGSVLALIVMLWAILASLAHL